MATSNVSWLPLSLTVHPDGWHVQTIPKVQSASFPQSTGSYSLVTGTAAGGEPVGDGDVERRWVAVAVDGPPGRVARAAHPEGKECELSEVAGVVQLGHGIVQAAPVGAGHAPRVGKA